MAGNLIRTEITLLSIGEGDGPEEVGLFAEDSGNLLALFRPQDDRSVAIRDVAAGCQERGNQMLAVPLSSNSVQFGTDGQFRGRFPTLLAQFVAANALRGSVIGYKLFAPFRITPLLKAVGGFRKSDPLGLGRLP